MLLLKQTFLIFVVITTIKKELAKANSKRHFSLTCARQPTLCQIL
nr:MAG TPA: hypothetical protein [Caudoviricetes sp.]